MKKVLLLVLLSLFVIAPLYAAMPYAPKQVIAINVGPKNPTLDESKFPDVKFYYTPGIKMTSNKVTGTPAILAKWFNQKGMNLDTGIVLDKNGVGIFCGFLIRTDGLDGARSQGHLDTLGNVLKETVEEGRPSPIVKNDPLALSDLSGLIGRHFPTFEVVDGKGQVTTTTAIINQSLPTMILIYHIPAGHKFQSAEDEMQNIRSPLQALSGMSNIMAGDEYTDLFKKIETELYGK